MGSREFEPIVRYFICRTGTSLIAPAGAISLLLLVALTAKRVSGDVAEWSKALPC